jgi:O-antigen/teichoic acid export membrane protein
VKVNHLTVQSAKGLIVRCSGLALLCLSAVVAAKILGAQQFGVYGTVLSLSPILAVIVVGGVDTFAIKAISIAAETPEKMAVEVAVSFAVAFLGIAVGLIAAGVFVVIAAGVDGLESACEVAYYCMLMFPATALYMMRRYISLPMIGAAGAMFPDQIILPVVLCGSILLVAMVSQVDVWAVVLLHTFASLVAWTYGMAQLWDKASLRQALHAPLSLRDVRSRLTRGRPFLMAGLATYFMTNTTPVLVSLVLGFREAGLFFAASRLASLPYFPLAVIDQVVMPGAARFHEQAERSNLARLARSGATLSFFMAVSIALSIAILRMPLLELFGSEFCEADTILLLLLIGCAGQTFFGNITAFLKMAGFERAFSRMMIVASVVLPAVVYLAARLGGVSAVAGAVTVFLMVFHGALTWFLYIKTGAKTIPYPPHVLLERLNQKGWNGASLSQKIGIIRGLLIS